MTGNDIEIIEDAGRIVRQVWAKTDFDDISSSRDLNDEFASRIATSAYTDTVYKFFSRLCKRWGVRSVSDAGAVKLMEKYDEEGGKFNSRDFLRVVRQNSELVVLQMQNKGDQE